MRTNVSPSTALRKWPMCAALLGLILVCSTITLPGACWAADPHPAAGWSHTPRGRAADSGIRRPQSRPRRYALDRGKIGRNFLRDGSRRFPQLASEIERDGQREFAERSLLGLLDADRRKAGDSRCEMGLICSRMRRSMMANTSFIVTGGSRTSFAAPAAACNSPADQSRNWRARCHPPPSGGQRRFSRLERHRRELQAI